jgi:ribulose-5-phosphate 4-epimerase/fuculose-1-phosphate aldolase
MLSNKVAYHAFEGTVTDLEEQPRLVANLGRKNLLILRNHGLLAIGRDISQMFISYWTLERACQIQMATDSMSGANQTLPREVIEGSPMRNKQANQPRNEDGTSGIFSAMLRKAGIRYEDIV